MIRVNLLPVRAAKRQEKGRVQLVIGVFVLFIALAVNWVWANMNQNALDRERQNVKRVKAEIAQLDKIIGKVTELDERKKELVRKLEILDKLRKARTGPVKMMDALSRAMPKDVWLTRFEEKAGQITIVGGAIDNDDVGEFISMLQRSPYFKDILLKKSQRSKNQDDEGTVEFTLTGMADYSA